MLTFFGLPFHLQVGKCSSTSSKTYSRYFLLLYVCGRIPGATAKLLVVKR